MQVPPPGDAGRPRLTESEKRASERFLGLLIYVPVLLIVLWAAGALLIGYILLGSASLLCGYLTDSWWALILPVLAAVLAILLFPEVEEGSGMSLGVAVAVRLVAPSALCVAVGVLARRAWKGYGL